MLTYIANRDPRQLKRDVRSVVLCVGAFILTMSIVSTMVFIFATFYEHPDLISSYNLNADMSENEAWSLDVTESLLETMYEYSGLASLLGIVCGLPWMLVIRGKKLFTEDAVKVNSKVKPGTLAILFVMIMGAQFLITLIQLGVQPFMDQSDASLSDVLDESTYNLATSFWGVMYIVIIGPICEELVFRGAVMRKLEKYGANFAIVVSALIFGLYHMILIQSVFAFFVGLILGYTAGRFSLKWAMLLHMINNGLAVVSLTLGSEIFDTALTLVYIACFVATIIILVTKRDMLKAQKQAGAPSEPGVFKRAFTSPWLIIYILVCVASGVQFLGLA